MRNSGPFRDDIGTKSTGIGSGSLLGLAGHRAQGVRDGLPAELLGIPDGRRQRIPQFWAAPGRQLTGELLGTADKLSVQGPFLGRG